MDYSIFQSRLKALMESRGLNIKALADDVNITTAALSRYLSGNRTPDLRYVVKLSEYFGVSIDWILGINGDRYEVLPQEIQDIAYLYSLATPDDRRVVQVVLNKYKKTEE